jgi:hypothetical protein
MAANLNIDKIKADYNLFIELQIKKYLEQCGKDKFSTNDETKAVVDKIVAVWNSEIADQHERLDNTDLEAKTEWFNSVEIDFDLDQQLQVTKSLWDGTDIDFMDMVEYYDELFPFLPKGAIVFLTFAGPAFEAYGYPIERYTKLFNGEEPTEIEKLLLYWAHNIAYGVMAFHIEKSASNRENIRSATLKIAEMELDPQTARKVFDDILTYIKEYFGDVHKKVTRTKTQKKKRK